METISLSEREKSNDECSIFDKIEKADSEAKHWIREGDNNKATHFLLGAAQLRRITYGSLHPETLSTFFTLGMILYRNHEYSEAERILRNVKALRRKLFGATHTLTLRTSHALGLVAKRLHKVTEAELLFRAAYEGYMSNSKSTNAPTRLNVAETAYALGIINVQYGYRHRALNYFQTAHDIFDAQLGPGHTLTSQAADCELMCIESQLKQSLQPKKYYKSDGRFCSKPLWKHSNRCYQCDKMFGLMTSFRHHCRICGESVCRTCSAYHCIVYEYDPIKPSRICEQCYHRGF